MPDVGKLQGNKRKTRWKTTGPDCHRVNSNILKRAISHILSSFPIFPFSLQIQLTIPLFFFVVLYIPMCNYFCPLRNQLGTSNPASFNAFAYSGF